jgi:hypothetical protein
VQRGFFGCRIAWLLLTPSKKLPSAICGVCNAQNSNYWQSRLTWQWRSMQLTDNGCLIRDTVRANNSHYIVMGGES